MAYQNLLDYLQAIFRGLTMSFCNFDKIRFLNYYGKFWYIFSLLLWRGLTIIYKIEEKFISETCGWHIESCDIFCRLLPRSHRVLFQWTETSEFTYTCRISTFNSILKLENKFFYFCNKSKKSGTDFVQSPTDFCTCCTKTIDLGP